MTKICQCHSITDGAARECAQTINPEENIKRTGARIFRAACNGEGCGGCNANFTKLAERLIAEGWKASGFITGIKRIGVASVIIIIYLFNDVFAVWINAHQNHIEFGFHTIIAFFRLRRSHMKKNSEPCHLPDQFDSVKLGLPLPFLRPHVW